MKTVVNYCNGIHWKNEENISPLSNDLQSLIYMVYIFTMFSSLRSLQKLEQTISTPCTQNYRESTFSNTRFSLGLLVLGSPYLSMLSRLAA